MTTAIIINLLPVFLFVLINLVSLTFVSRYRRMYKRLPILSVRNERPYIFMYYSERIVAVNDSQLEQLIELRNVINSLGHKDTLVWNTERDTFSIYGRRLSRNWSYLNLVATYWHRKYKKWLEENIIIDEIKR